MFLEEKMEQMAQQLEDMKAEFTALKMRVSHLEAENEAYERKHRQEVEKLTSDHRIPASSGQGSNVKAAQGPPLEGTQPSWVKTEKCEETLPTPTVPKLTAAVGVHPNTGDWTSAIPNPNFGDGGLEKGMHHILDEISASTTDASLPMCFEVPNGIAGTTIASGSGGDRNDAVNDWSPLATKVDGRSQDSGLPSAQGPRLDSVPIQRERNHVCDKCGKAYLNIRSLREHAAEVHGDKKYACEQCGKTFTRKRSLSLHYQVHSAQKKYVCEHCGKGFAQKHKLPKHRLRTCPVLLMMS